MKVMFKNITLKEMLEDLVKWVLGEECKYGGEFYYRNVEGGYFEITEVDLMRSRFKIENDDFSEYDWELEESHIYVKEENDNKRLESTADE